MKKIFLCFMGVFMVPCLVYGAGDYTTNKDFYGDLNFRPRYNENTAYMGIRGSLSFLDWKNKYKDETGAHLGSDDFNFKSMVGMNVFLGYQGFKQWRGDVEFGYIGRYSENEMEYNDGFSSEKYDFDLETFYLTLNGYYELNHGFYAGLGVGMAAVNASVDANWLAKKSETNISPMGAAMLGWSYKLDEKVNFDLRYRFAVFDGGDLKVNVPGGTSYVKTDFGLIMDNSLSAGIRYSF